MIFDKLTSLSTPLFLNIFVKSIVSQKPLENYAIKSNHKTSDFLDSIKVKSTLLFIKYILLSLVIKI